MNYLLIDIPNNTEILETTEASDAISELLSHSAAGNEVELFIENSGIWFGWTDYLGFIGPRPKHPPTR